uniref:hypothetical protein n=1 Tax=Paraglaciecola sp. TaxID=1920173 RepID=UPI0030F39BEC
LLDHQWSDYARYKLNRSTTLPQVSISIPKKRLSLCAYVIDRCFCALVFSRPVGNALFALFRKAGVIVTECRLFSANTP